MLTRPSGISAQFQTTFHFDSPGGVAASGIWTTQNWLCSPACGAGRPYVGLCPIFLVIYWFEWRQYLWLQFSYKYFWRWKRKSLISLSLAAIFQNGCPPNLTFVNISTSNCPSNMILVRKPVFSWSKNSMKLFLNLYDQLTGCSADWFGEFYTYRKLDVRSVWQKISCMRIRTYWWYLCQRIF